MATTAKDVASWMATSFKRDGVLYQVDAVDGVIENFGDTFTYINENGNTAIRGDVLTQFQLLTSDTAVWDRQEKVWRARTSEDEKGRLADY